ncbi:uncharacterized protein [Apostichopus japonicus]|uniref:uncharacterized protein n=1 Tax=Stichopus japonicus TaxID=307972 RepID=UPI003AB15AC0
MEQFKLLNKLKFMFIFLAVVMLLMNYYLAWNEACDTTGVLLCNVERQKGVHMPDYASYQTDQLEKALHNFSGRNHSNTENGLSSRHNSHHPPSTTRNDSYLLQSKCLSVPNTGPITKTVHITKETNSTSNCIVFGDGLLGATVGEPAHITIKPRSFNKKELYDTIFFSVLAVGNNHIFHAFPSRINLTSLKIKFTYIPTIPGQYDLFVEEISRHLQKQLPGSPFKLVVNGPAINKEERKKIADHLPSCQTLPQTDLSWLEGNWVTRDLAGEKRGTLRSGWVLQPNRCSIDIFTKDDLRQATASPSLKTIFVLGRSTERGVFLSLVDILLTIDEKREIKSSILWKCWGLMEIRLGNLRFVYQDFRIEDAPMENINDSDHVQVTCHNEKNVGSSKDLFSDAIGFFKETLFTDRFRPDVILLIVTNSLHLTYLTKTIPASWDGIIYTMNGFKCHDGSLYTYDGRQADIRVAEKILTFDKRFRALDGFALATPLRHATQSSPKIMKAFHWHRPCKEQDGEIQVCGDATEMVAQILLGKAIAPNGKDAWLSSLENCGPKQNNLKRNIEVCHDCPKQLIPWHIKKVPNPICYNSTVLLQTDDTDIQAWGGSLCPNDCMKTAPVGQEDVKSGRVDVRICTVLTIEEPNN